MIMARFSPAVSIALALLFLGSSLFGQAQSGTIVGTVADQTGAAMPAATVTLLQEETRFSRTQPERLPRPSSTLGLNN